MFNLTLKNKFTKKCASLFYLLLILTLLLTTTKFVVLGLKLTFYVYFLCVSLIVNKISGVNKKRLISNPALTGQQCVLTSDLSLQLLAFSTVASLMLL